METYDIQAACLKAICRLLVLDQELLKLAANERSISHKLAEYLSPEFQEYHVDCEYNRVGHERDTKRLDFLLKNTDGFADEDDEPQKDVKARTVYPDIIVHRRTTNDNLLVIEMKTTSSSVVDSKDDNKLKLFTSRDQMNDYHYALGLFIHVTTGRGLKDRSPAVARGIWYEDGKRLTKDLQLLCEVAGPQRDEPK